MHKVFIDGQNGTTGLQIHERLRRRDDIELLIIDEAQRKNPQAKKT
jgi:N-acetyl-gamma-glutamyl-phosphate reductase